MKTFLLSLVCLFCFCGVATAHDVLVPLPQIETPSVQVYIPPVRIQTPPVYYQTIPQFPTPIRTFFWRRWNQPRVYVIPQPYYYYY